MSVIIKLLPGNPGDLRRSLLTNKMLVSREFTIQ
jgi:hypothetical protein